MAKFNYRQDVLVKIWRQNQFTIEAETQEEADEIAAEICADEYDVADNDDTMDDIEFSESEFLFETETPCGKMEIYRGDYLVVQSYDF